LQGRDRRKGNSKSFGFVHFENSDCAGSAIATVNGMILESKQVYVGFFVPKKERIKLKEASWTNVYVKNLAPEAVEEDLMENFSQFGSVNSCVVMFDENGVSRKFGFVNFDRHEDAVKAVESLNDSPIHGKKDLVRTSTKEIRTGRRIKKKIQTTENTAHGKISRDKSLRKTFGGRN